MIQCCTSCYRHQKKISISQVTLICAALAVSACSSCNANLYNTQCASRSLLSLLPWQNGSLSLIWFPASSVMTPEIFQPLFVFLRAVYNTKVAACEGCLAQTGEQSDGHWQKCTTIPSHLSCFTRLGDLFLPILFHLIPTPIDFPSKINYNKILCKGFRL